MPVINRWMPMPDINPSKLMSDINPARSMPDIYHLRSMPDINPARPIPDIYHLRSMPTLTVRSMPNFNSLARVSPVCGLPSSHYRNYGVKGVTKCVPYQQCSSQAIA